MQGSCFVESTHKNTSRSALHIAAGELPGVGHVRYRLVGKDRLSFPRLPKTCGVCCAQWSCETLWHTATSAYYSLAAFVASSNSTRCPAHASILHTIQQYRVLNQQPGCAATSHPVCAPAISAQGYCSARVLRRTVLTTEYGLRLGGAVLCLFPLHPQQYVKQILYAAAGFVLMTTHT